MTEYELTTLLQASLGNVIAVQALFFSALSAYLIVAYLVGAKLSRTQVSTVTGIFSLFCLLLLLTIFSLSAQMAEYGNEIASINSERQVGGTVLWALLVAAIFASGYVVALIFMAQIRRKARSGDK